MNSRHDCQSSVAQRVVENTTLILLQRLITVVLVPICMMVGAWVVQDLVALSRRVAVVESQREEFDRRVRIIEQSVRESAAEYDRLVTRLSNIETGVATLAADQRSTLSVVTRIQSILDRAFVVPPASGFPQSMSPARREPSP